MKLKHLFALAAIAVSGSAWAQDVWKDVTSTYIKNADFEGEYSEDNRPSSNRAIYLPTGWTLEHATKNENDFTALKNGDLQYADNFAAGKVSQPTNGDTQTLWTRLRWGGQVWKSTGTEGKPDVITFSQKASLPNGIYRLSADMFCFSSGTEANNHVYLKANDKSVEASFNRNKTTGSWENKSFEFVCAGNTEVTIACQTMQNWQVELISGFDNIKLERREVSKTETYDLTTQANNTSAGWTINGSNNNGTTNCNGTTLVERYYEQHHTGKVTDQTVAVPNGIYNVEVYCHAYCASWNCTPVAEADGQTGYTQMTVNDQVADIPVHNSKSFLSGTPDVYSLENVHVTDGKLVFTVTNLQEAANWLTVGIKSITYLGADMEAWDKAKLAVQEVLDEYNASYNGYASAERQAIIDAMTGTPADADEMETMIDNLKSLVDPYKVKAQNEKLMDDKKPLTNAIARIKTEYPNSSNEVLNTDLSKWNTSKYVVMNAAEHWSGANSYKYYEQSSAQWGQNSWSIYAEHTVNLPAGKYAFVVTARAAAETTSKMTVNGEEIELCHKGSVGYGIATDGEATFDMSKTYANNGVGRGWEYAYAEFVLTEAKDVTFRFDASTSTVHNWVSIANPILYYNDDAKDAMEIVRRQAVIDQIAGVLGTDDANVPTGKMNAEVKTALDDAVTAAKAGTTSNTVDELTGFKAALETAIANANTSVANYAKVEPYNTKAAVLDDAGQTAYTSTLEAYNNGTMTKGGEQAQAKAAYLAAVKAQTSENANMTDVLNNPSFEEGTGGWENRRNTTGTYDYSTKTDGPADGTKVLNVWAQQFNYSNVWQKQTLPAGHYKLSAKVRTNAEPLENQTQIRTYVAGNMTSASEGLSTYRTENWNTVEAWVTLTTEFRIAKETEVEMGIYSSGRNISGNSQGWFQVDDFQLIRVDDKDTEATIAVTDAKWATFIAPFDVTIPAGIEAYSCKAKDANDVLTLVQVKTTIPANTPVILNAAEPASDTQYGKNVATEDKYTVGWLTGTHVDEEVGTGKYMLAKKDGKVGFYPTNAGRVNKAGKAYLTVPASVKADALFFPGDADAIMAIEALTSGKAEIYDLSGKKLNTLQKGINIVNGKKIMVK